MNSRRTGVDGVTHSYLLLPNPSVWPKVSAQSPWSPVFSGSSRELGCVERAGEQHAGKTSACSREARHKGKLRTLSKGHGLVRSFEVQSCGKSELFLAVPQGKINNNCHARPEKEENARSQRPGPERVKEVKQIPTATVTTTESLKFTHMTWEEWLSTDLSEVRENPSGLEMSIPNILILSVCLFLM